MTKTNALKTAATYCSISGRNTSWTVYGPYSVEVDDLRGPYTEHQCDSYAKALRVLTTWRATIALSLLGKLDDDARWALEDDQSGSLRDRVNAVLAGA